jgi:hypothetical protein
LWHLGKRDFAGKTDRAGLETALIWQFGRGRGTL